MKITDLFNLDDLARDYEAGYVRIQSHPDNLELKIANYTNKTQCERHWSDVTRACRGLIFDSATFEVLALPFPKFFNYGEHPEGSLDLDAPAVVTNKLDGSLGIMYEAPDGLPAIATRGSFTSEQAKVGTRILREKHLPDWRDWAGDLSLATYLFEIIYPENRIVVDYGPLADIVLLGFVNLSDGKMFSALSDFSFPGYRTGESSASTLREALALPPRENVEGLVVRLVEDGTMVKLKQDDYVQLHRLVTGLNERVVWEHMLEHEGDFDGLLEKVPEEFHDWIHQVVRKFEDSHDDIQGQAHEAFYALRDELEAEYGIRGWERKQFALIGRRRHPELMPYLFALLDGKDLFPMIWKAIKPSGERDFHYDSEEVAA